MKNLLKNEVVMIVVPTTLLILLSLVPFFYQAANTPKNHVFLGIHNYAEDYFVYLSEIRQGQNGHILNDTKYDSSVRYPALVRPIYPILGILSKPFDVSPDLVYNFSRIGASIFLFLSAYWLIKTVFDKKRERLIAYFLVLLSAGFAVLNTQGPSCLIQIKNLCLTPESRLMTVWTGFDNLIRASFLPHHALANACLIAALTLIIKMLGEEKNKKTSYKKTFGPRHAELVSASNEIPKQVRDDTFSTGSKINLVILLLFIAGIAAGFPVYLTFFLFFVFCLWVVTIIRDRQRISAFSPLLVTTILTSIPLILYYKETYSHEPWKAISSWEAYIKLLINTSDHILIYGPTLILTAVGFIIALKKIDPQKTAISVFVIAGILFSFLNPFQKIGLSNHRFFDLPLFIPLAIISAIPVIELTKKKTRVAKVALFLIFLIITSNFALSSIGSLRQQILWLAPESYNRENTLYPPREIIESVNFLKKYTSEKDNVLANYEISRLIPALAGNYVYVGFNYTTIFNQERAGATEDFLQKEISNEDAEKYLRTNKIQYVAALSNEKVYLSPFSFLKPVFKNNGVAVFVFQK